MKRMKIFNRLDMKWQVKFSWKFEKQSGLYQKKKLNLKIRLKSYNRKNQPKFKNSKMMKKVIAMMNYIVYCSKVNQNIKNL